MQVSVENISTVETRLKIQVPAEEVKKQIDARLREIGKQVKLKGFRPGRIPFSVLNQRYGAAGEAGNHPANRAVRPCSRLCSRSHCVLRRIPGWKANRCWMRLVWRSTRSSKPTRNWIRSMSPISSLNDRMSVSSMVMSQRCWKHLKKQRIKWKDVERKPVDGDQVLVEYTAKTDEDTDPGKGHTPTGSYFGTVWL